MSARKIGIGIVGGGIVAQAIHLPALAALTDIFEIRRIVDVTPATSQAVAERCGAAGSTSIDDILNDEAIEVVAIFSPDRFHAEQVVAACRAGKKAVLCEKPLATSMAEAETIRAAAESTGTTLFVGTMHAYDVAYRAGLQAWRATGDRARHIRSAIYLPKNEEFIDQATEALYPDAPPPGPQPANRAKAMLRRAMLGLAIHDLPLVRDFQPAAGKLLSAEFLDPFGYALLASNGACITELTAVMPGAWPAKWTFEVTGRQHRLTVTMPPSFVMAGSARVELEGPDGCQVFTAETNGYQQIWKAIENTVNTGAPAPFAAETVVGDLGFALDLADGADELMGEAS